LYLSSMRSAILVDTMNVVLDHALFTIE